MASTSGISGVKHSFPAAISRELLFPHAKCLSSMVLKLRPAEDRQPPRPVRSSALPPSFVGLSVHQFHIDSTWPGRNMASFRSHRCATGSVSAERLTRCLCQACLW